MPLGHERALNNATVGNLRPWGSTNCDMLAVVSRSQTPQPNMLPSSVMKVISGTRTQREAIP